ncbi:MAG: carbamoyl-phosphate synthase large subunit [Planctomycetota bacterium]
MPKREDLRSILIIGSGPIVIGQGCEFDYSGAQACKSLKDEGFRIVLVNSNPATIMTDPALSDRTYIEPITPETVRKIIELERDRGTPIEAILPTLGGQTGLNCACKLHDDGVLAELGIELIGADREVIHRAEDRDIFRRVCDEAGLPTPPSRTVGSLDEALDALEEYGLPSIIRPAFTLGGFGGGIAYNAEEFRDLVQRGLDASMITQVQVDKSLIGWKEFELEVVRDHKDNCIVVCGIENIDAMGVHTGDSITVAPCLTLTDKEYQALRDAALTVMRRVGVETGGSNVQFAVNPNPEGTHFDYVVVEMNPRVSRSSALASKATGFPIAKIAAKLAVGYTLDELRNDITGTTSACFEPSIDYIVTKIPRWTFEKFPEADETLTTQMKSVGEVMAIGRTFKESFQKALRSLDVKRFGLGLDRNDKWLAAQRSEDGRTADGQPIEWPIDEDKLTRKLAVPSQGRVYYVRYALKMGWSIERVCELTRIDPFFVDQIAQLVEFEDDLAAAGTLEALTPETLAEAKRLGYSDAQLANLYLGSISSDTILRVRRVREASGIRPVFKLVDTCSAEFEAITPYYYSTYEHAQTRSGLSWTDDEIRVSPTEKAIILGGGPNRIGQGCEFDYCCVHAAFAARELGYESVMINCNPETVSTDYDTSDLLFFEPLTLEDVLNVVETLNGPVNTQADAAASGLPEGLVKGVIVQFGGQTPLNLAGGLDRAGVPLIGTSLDSIDLAEDRERFDAMLESLGLQRPASGIARSLDGAIGEAERIGYPVLVRPSYVLGGRGMEICYDEAALTTYMTSAIDVAGLDDAPVLIDRFLSGATEIDVDVVADFDPAGSTDRGQALVCGVMEHIEQAGVHSGDSSCTIPCRSLPVPTVETIRETARTLARALRVQGLMNVQMAVKDGEVSIIEVNPRASRTVPFVGKSKHMPWASIAAKVMLGRSLDALGASEIPDTGAHAVKEAVFPFSRFPGVDVILGPEMRSTGEVMGIDVSLPIAVLKASMAAGNTLPSGGGVFLSVREADKTEVVAVARSLAAMGFKLFTTRGTGESLAPHGIRPTVLEKLSAGARPNVLDMMADGDIQLVINTPTRTGFGTDEGRIRAATVRLGIPIITTMTGAIAAVEAIQALRAGDWGVAALQDYAERAQGVTGGV